MQNTALEPKLFNLSSKVDKKSSQDANSTLDAKNPRKAKPKPKASRKDTQNSDLSLIPSIVSLHSSG